ncbi:hypothetical protein [Streptomyces sp. NPDC053541]|uniref:hypothetical protein n=1 Tax=Streptomyces sp. NPDC053541 TaxID=3365709 RepID=UPI0037CE5421
MKLSLLVHQVRLGAREFQVVRPGRPLPHAVLIDRAYSLDAYVDKEAAERIGGLWTLAAMSPRALVHLPIRANRPPVPGPPEDTPRLLDLVLLHHSLQFAPADWKDIRSRLGRGRPRTVTLSAAALEADAGLDPAARHHRENRDLIHQHVRAETLFMTGSAKVFRETAGHFHELARTGPEDVAPYPHGPHHCTRFRSDDGTLANGREIHVEYAPVWSAS